MDLDAYRQLPIPEWLRLACPKCEYPLRGLPEHRCPECGLAFNIDDLITPAVPLRPPEITPQTRPVPELGLTCDACDGPLAGATGDRCPACGEPFDLAAFVPAESWVEVAAWQNPTEKQLIFMHLRAAGIACVVVNSAEVLRTVYGVQGPVVGGGLRVRQDYYLDALRAIEASRGSGGADWKCAKCGEDVPGNFEVCWKCQSPRGA